MLYPIALRARSVYYCATGWVAASIRYSDRLKKIETEIKLALASAAKGRALLRRHGFEIVRPRVFEQNLVLDDAAGSLYERNVLLRVRRAGKTVTCTAKGAELPGRHKRREEHEFVASAFEPCLEFFATLGYRESFRYEKYRTELAIPGEPGHVTLDETPVGVYLELEGPARWIDRTAKKLGFAPETWIKASYGRLYTDWCASRGIEATSMRF
jgi:adenylate cyclase class 2